ncbi:MAG: hypothetical protein FJZ63_00140 [Chlamydiae bacterium]|nr:hypothetical protein [Chlamydiota bacterium]
MKRKQKNTSSFPTMGIFLLCLPPLQGLQLEEIWLPSPTLQLLAETKISSWVSPITEGEVPVFFIQNSFCNALVSIWNTDSSSKELEFNPTYAFFESSLHEGAALLQKKQLLSYHPTALPLSQKPLASQLQQEAIPSSLTPDKESPLYPVFPLHSLHLLLTPRLSSSTQALSYLSSLKEPLPISLHPYPDTLPSKTHSKFKTPTLSLPLSPAIRANCSKDKSLNTLPLAPLPADSTSRLLFPQSPFLLSLSLQESPQTHLLTVPDWETPISYTNFLCTLDKTSCAYIPSASLPLSFSFKIKIDLDPPLSDTQRPLEEPCNFDKLVYALPSTPCVNPLQITSPLKTLQSTSSSFFVYYIDFEEAPFSPWEFTQPIPVFDLRPQATSLVLHKESKQSSKSPLSPLQETPLVQEFPISYPSDLNLSYCFIEAPPLSIASLDYPIDINSRPLPLLSSSFLRPVKHCPAFSYTISSTKTFHSQYSDDPIFLAPIASTVIDCRPIPFSLEQDFSSISLAIAPEKPSPTVPLLTEKVSLETLIGLKTPAAPNPHTVLFLNSSRIDESQVTFLLHALPIANLDEQKESSPSLVCSSPSFESPAISNPLTLGLYQELHPTYTPTPTPRGFTAFSEVAPLSMTKNFFHPPLCCFLDREKALSSTFSLVDSLPSFSLTFPEYTASASAPLSQPSLCDSLPYPVTADFSYSYESCKRYLPEPPTFVKVYFKENPHLTWLSYIPHAPLSFYKQPCRDYPFALTPQELSYKYRYLITLHQDSSLLFPKALSEQVSLSHLPGTVAYIHQMPGTPNPFLSSSRKKTSTFRAYYQTPSLVVRNKEVTPSYKSAQTLNTSLRRNTSTKIEVPTLQELHTSTLSEDFEVAVEIIPSPKESSYLFAITLTPPKEHVLPHAPQNIIFLLDRSSGIEKNRFQVFKQAISKALMYLHDGDTFNILSFDMELSKMSHDSVFVTASSKLAAKRFLENQRRGFKYVLPNLYEILLTTHEMSKASTLPTTVVLLTNGNNLDKFNVYNDRLSYLVSNNKSNFSLFTACASQNNNSLMLEILSTLNKGEILHSQTHAAFPRKLASFVKHAGSLIAQDVHVTAIQPQGNASIELSVDSNLFPNLYSDRPYTILGKIDSLQDFDLVLQGRFCQNWLNITKKISFKNAQTGNYSIYKRYSLETAYNQYREFLKEGNTAYLDSATKVLYPFN